MRMSDIPMELQALVMNLQFELMIEVSQGRLLLEVVDMQVELDMEVRRMAISKLQLLAADPMGKDIAMIVVVARAERAGQAGQAVERELGDKRR